jgi:hypothetical protein
LVVYVRRVENIIRDLTEIPSRDSDKDIVQSSRLERRDIQFRARLGSYKMT